MDAPRDQVLYLSHQDVARVGPSMSEIIAVLEQAFREKGNGRVEMPPKPGIHPGGADNFIHAMPAYIPAMGAAGVKWVSGYPGNRDRGLPFINGLLVLNDPETACPSQSWTASDHRRAYGRCHRPRRPLPRPARLHHRRHPGLRCAGQQQPEALKAIFPCARPWPTTPPLSRRTLRLGDVPTPGHGSAPRSHAPGGGQRVRPSPPAYPPKPHATIKAGWLDEGPCLHGDYTLGIGQPFGSWTCSAPTTCPSCSTIRRWATSRTSAHLR